MSQPSVRQAASMQTRSCQRESCGIREYPRMPGRSVVRGTSRLSHAREVKARFAARSGRGEVLDREGCTSAKHFGQEVAFAKRRFSSSGLAAPGIDRLLTYLEFSSHLRDLPTPFDQRHGSLPELRRVALPCHIALLLRS